LPEFAYDIGVLQALYAAVFSSAEVLVIASTQAKNPARPVQYKD